MLEFILKYWVEFVCGLVAAGIGVFAKHYVKLQKKALEDAWRKKEQAAKDEVIKKLEGELEEEIKKSEEADDEMKEQIEGLSYLIDNLTQGVLSIQGKQFRDICLYLLDQDHYITIQEYEQFEEDYMAYKALGGNHRGDALHDRVVEKFTNQLK